VQHVALLNALTDVNDCDEMGLTSYYRHGPVSCLRYATDCCYSQALAAADADCSLACC
jgi:hypothetical protein